MDRREEKRFFVHYFPMYGCISTGIIYVAIGVIAILSFLKLKSGGADEGSFLAFLNSFLVGKIFIWIIMLGAVSYIIWRIYETIKDPYEYGKGTKGILLRAGIALSTTADFFIAYSAVQVLIGAGHIPADGQPTEQRKLVSMVLKEDWGVWVVICLGSIILITAAIQFIYGITRGYKERLDIGHFSSVKENIIHFLAGAGYLARGVILGIIGYFFIEAGITENAGVVVNTDKAFDFIGDHVGHVYFILTALGTICYGLFMFTLGITYDIDKD